MPLISQRPLVAKVTTAQQYTPPTPRELRAQAIYRLQVGLFGLATMMLMVALANIVMDRARQSEAATGAAPTTEASSNPNSDPLADLGVVPSAEPASNKARLRGHR